MAEEQEVVEEKTYTQEEHNAGREEMYQRGKEAGKLIKDEEKASCVWTAIDSDTEVLKLDNGLLIRTPDGIAFALGAKYDKRSGIK